MSHDDIVVKLQMYLYIIESSEDYLLDRRSPSLLDLLGGERPRRHDFGSVFIFFLWVLCYRRRWRGRKGRGRGRGRGGIMSEQQNKKNPRPAVPFNLTVRLR